VDEMPRLGNASPQDLHLQRLHLRHPTTCEWSGFAVWSEYVDCNAT
jgi:hypothetical protein